MGRELRILCAIVCAGVILLLGSAQLLASPGVHAPQGKLRGPDPDLRWGQAADSTQDPGSPAPTAPKKRTRRKVYNGMYLLYFYEHDPVDKESLFHMLGLFWYRDKPDWRLYVTPLGAYWRWKEQERWGMITPLAWHVESEDSSYTGAWLWHKWSSPESTSSLLFPLYWHHTDFINEYSTNLVGPVYWEENPRGWQAGVFPLFWLSQEEETHRGTIFPLLTWWEVNEDTQSFLQFPLFWHHEELYGTLRMLTPLIWGYRKSFSSETGGVFPAYLGMERPDYSFRLLLPALYARYHDRDTDERFTMLGPLYSWEDGEQWQAGLWPLIKAAEDPGEEEAETLFFPLYYGYQRGQRERHRWFLPFLYANSQWGEDSFKMVGPWFKADFAQEHWSGLAPLLWLYDNDHTGSSTRVLGTGWWHEDPNGWSAGLAPLAMAQRDHQRDLTRFGLFPFYYGREREQYASTLGAVLWAWGDHEAERHNVVAGPLYHFSNKKGSDTGLFPLAHWSEREDHTRAWLLPLAYYDKTRTSKTVAVAPVYYNEDQTSKTVVAGPVFYGRDDEARSRTWGVAPLVVHHEDQYSSTNVVFPAFFHHQNPQGHTFMSPLYWSRRQGEDWSRWSVLYGAGGNREGSWQTLFPLFWSSRSADGAGWDMALPLYGRWNGAGGKEGGAVLFPFYWNFYNEARAESSTVLFPFYWNFQTEKRKLIIVLPWFMSQRLDEKRLTHGLIPLYYYSEDKYGYTFSMLGGMVGVDHDNASEETDYQVLWIPF